MPNTQKRAACSGNGILVAELSDGVITDALNRTGYIASNYQFQFDKPPQSGAIYTAGFSHCSNGSLALGGSAVFYQCRSGNFYNLYDRWWAEQCSPVEILVMPCGGSADESDGGADYGQVVGTATVATTVVIPLSDGQPQVISTQTVVRICQIGDGAFPFPRPLSPAQPKTPPHKTKTNKQSRTGQIQGHTTPCAAQPTPMVSIPPASQYSDGQIQVTPPATATASATEPLETTLRTTSAPGGASGPGVVPTAAPPAEVAGAGNRVRIGAATGAALVLGLAVGGVGWFW
ncbi:hypothetical protein VTK56DRAFT_1272 [Thermocarpiscus australiensis]